MHAGLCCQCLQRPAGTAEPSSHQAVWCEVINLQAPPTQCPTRSSSERRCTISANTAGLVPAEQAAAGDRQYLGPGSKRATSIPLSEADTCLPCSRVCLDAHADRCAIRLGQTQAAENAFAVTPVQLALLDNMPARQPPQVSSNVRMMLEQHA